MNNRNAVFRNPPCLPPRGAQRGVVLFISLIVLVAMTLAGIAMFRQVATGVVIAGNLAFRENAASVSDMGLEAARVWLLAQSSATLQTDLLPVGYHSCALPPAVTCAEANFNPATYDWSASATQVTPDDGTGNEVRYVVHRLCTQPGLAVNDPLEQCVTIGSFGVGGSKGGGSYGVLPLANTMQPYFRITTRVAGPRNTVSYVQAIMF